MSQIPIIIKDCNGNDLELGIIMNIVVDGYNICYKPNWIPKENVRGIG